MRIASFQSFLRCGLFSAGTIIIFLAISSNFHEGIANGTLSDTFVSVAKHVKPSVVNIRTTKVLKEDMLKRGRRKLPHGQLGKGFEIMSHGSGVIVDKKGYIVTNNHLVNSVDEIIVKFYDGSEFKAEIVGTDNKTDIAVLKVDAENLEPAEFGDSDSMEIGEIVLAVGCPFGLEQTVTSGIISAKGRSNIRIAEYEEFLQTDATISPGCSGGPLVNLQGQVVGISTAILKQKGDYFGISFVIPINIAKRIMEDLITQGKVTRGWLGITAQVITPELQDILGLKNNVGVLISNIEPGSPAETAGLQTSDVVIEYDGKKVKDLFYLRNLVTRTEINKEIELVVIRDGKKLNVNVTIVARSKEDTIDQKTSARDIGLIVQTLTPELALNLGYEGEKGIVITKIQIDSPAFEASLRKGDLIVEVQHKRIESVIEFQKVVLNILHGEDILMFIKRQNGTSKFVVIKARKIGKKNS